MLTKTARAWLAHIGSKGGRMAARNLTKAQRHQRAKKARAARGTKLVAANP